jgi:HSP20 family molecular chaperone IbpA
VDPSTVELKLLGNLLTISAERKAGREAKDVDYLYRELSYWHPQSHADLA